MEFCDPLENIFSHEHKATIQRLGLNTKHSYTCTYNTVGVLSVQWGSTWVDTGHILNLSFSFLLLLSCRNIRLQTPDPRLRPDPPQQWTPRPTAPAPPSTSWRNSSWLLHRTWKNWTSINTMRWSVSWGREPMGKWTWSSTKSEVTAALCCSWYFI